jgi:hypothetical protein
MSRSACDSTEPGSTSSSTFPSSSTARMQGRPPRCDYVSSSKMVAMVNSNTLPCELVMLSKCSATVDVPTDRGPDPRRDDCARGAGPLDEPVAHGGHRELGDRLRRRHPVPQAEPGLDYAAAQGTVVFAPGETEATVTIEVVADALPESDEGLFVRSSPLSANSVAAASSSARRTCSGPDGAPSGHRGPGRGAPRSLDTVT